MLKRIALAAALAAAVAAGADGVAERLRVELHLQPERSEAEIDAAFFARSTPGNRYFRRHLTSKQLKGLVGAPEARVSRVRLALKALGATNIKVLAHNDIITADVPSAAVRGFALDTLAAEPKPFRRSVPVPRALAGDVKLAIAARGVMPLKRSAPESRGAAGFPGASQTPQSLMKRYSVPAGRPSVPANYTQGVAEFQQSYFRQSDIETFSNHFGIPVPKVLVQGPNSPSADDTEGTLDVEYMTAVSGALTTWWVSHNAFDFTQWTEQLLKLDVPPSVVSISWGQGEFAYYGNEGVLWSDNAQFRKLGLMGISVFAASGDSGPGARGYTSCSKFMPGWPASSPYVTTVGATYANDGQPEVAVDFSGGGFSTVMAMPEYQKEAVRTYLQQSNLPKASYFNQSGRAYPDVAALGTNFQVFGPSAENPTGPGSWQPVAGTSCASPTFAGIIARINGERMAQGQPALGFLNPALYKLGKVGQDVTAGRSIDNNCFGIVQEKGFPAVAGWDAVSGLGTPDYEFLKANL